MGEVRQGNAPQASSGIPAVMMPGYGGQCSVFGYSKDAQGNRINLQVAMPGGSQQTFATEAQYAAACGGAMPQPNYPGVPSGYAPGPQAPQAGQTINIALPGPSAPSNDAALWAALFAKDTPSVSSAPPPIATQQPTGYTYVPSADASGVAYAPSADQPQPTLAPAPDAPATPWWIWLGLGAAALYAFKGKK